MGFNSSSQSQFGKSRQIHFMRQKSQRESGRESVRPLKTMPPFALVGSPGCVRDVVAQAAALQRVRDAAAALVADDPLRRKVSLLLDDITPTICEAVYERKRPPRPTLPHRSKYLNSVKHLRTKQLRRITYDALDTFIQTCFPPMTSAERQRKQKHRAAAEQRWKQRPSSSQASSNREATEKQPSSSRAETEHQPSTN